MLSETNKARKKCFLSDFAINPRGELWKKDEQNFGCKLMKKMGWKNGSGLGKNGHGITQPIRLVQTHDNEGLGYSKQTSDYSWNWLSHQDDYNSLLNQLKEQYTSSLDHISSTVPEGAATSHQALDLEKKSKKSQKRVHYKRAIQGKDLSNRSAADWQCILGKKRKRHIQKPDETVESGVENQELLLTSVVTSNKYFMEKRLKLEAKRKKSNPGEQMHLGNDDGSVPVEVPEQQTTRDDSEKKRKKKRKKRKLEKGPKEVDFLEDEHILPDQDDRLEKENQLQAEDSLLILKKTKRKMKKKKKRPELKTISDMTNVEQSNTGPLTNVDIPLGSESSSNLTETLGIKCILKKRTFDDLKSDLKVDSTNHQKKRVRFMDTPIIGYVPRKDFVRGGAWMWKINVKFQNV